MITEHTPGPWVAFTDGSHTNIVAVVPRTHCVFSLPGHDKNEPNVRLIAAAPELLEKCQKIVDWLDRLASKSEIDALDTRFESLSKACAADARNYRRTANDIQGVINKATGE